MAKTTLYFTSSADLTQTVGWVYKTPPKTLPAQSAYHYCLLQQIDEENCGLLFNTGDNSWLYRKCASQGPIGTTYLFDANDLLQRVGKEDVWKRHALLVSATKRNKLRVECVTEVQNNEAKAAGNIEISTYPGDLADFILPEETDWQSFTQILDGWVLRKQSLLLENFAALKSNSARKPIWLRFKDNTLSILASEKDSNQGLSMLCCKSKCYAPELSFGLAGQYVQKLAQVFETDSVITIQVDDLEDPSKVKFSGDKGWVILPTIDEYQARELSVGAVNVFFPPDNIFQDVCDRTYHLTELSDRLALQRPKPDSGLKDVLVEEVDNNLVLSKLYDYQKHEMSSAAAWTLDGKGEWPGIVFPFNYADDALDTMDKFLTKELQELDQEQSVCTDFDDEPATGPSPKLITLRLSKATNARGNSSHYLYFEHPDFTNSQAALCVNLKEAMQDYREPD